ncbi:MAG: porin [Burkholderiaceae bacterium]|nr:porin [Burkholderiaceae bacterium]
MKKTQVALAAVALVASAAAMADVTVYGTVDVGVAHNSNGTNLYGAGNSGTTLFGLKGTEDLGGGLKAGFNLESGINAATGALGANGGVGTALFNRNANVSLSTENAGLTVGTQISPFILAGLTGTTAVGGNGAFVPALFRLDGGSLAGITVGNTGTGGFFIPGAISANFNANGVSAAVMQRIQEKSSSENGYTAGNLSGSFGGVNLAVGYQRVSPNTGVATSNVLVAANTSVGALRVNAAYANNSGTVDSKGYILGASMPLAGALSGGLTYSNNDRNTIGRATTVSLQYDLSKATYAYVNYSSFGVASNGGAAANDAAGLAAAKSLLAVGLSHSF